MAIAETNGAKPGLAEAIHRLDAVQQAVRTEVATRPIVEPQVVWEAPSLAQLVQRKNETRVTYMGQPHVAREVPTETRHRRHDGRNHSISKNGVSHPSTNEHEQSHSVAAKPNQEPVVVVPNVPTQLVGGVAARIGGKPW